jgi:single-stranded DNA-binding protein
MRNNIVSITGNLGEKKDPKQYTKKDGAIGIVATFPIAVYINDQKTMWIDIVCFDQLADQYYANIQKGYSVSVIGRLDFYKYQGTDNKDHKVFQVVADNISWKKPKDSESKGDFKNAIKDMKSAISPIGSEEPF